MVSINRQGEVKKSIGNGEAKEFICMTHGCELSGEECWWEGRCRVKGNEGEKTVGQV